MLRLKPLETLRTKKKWQSLSEGERHVASFEAACLLRRVYLEKGPTWRSNTREISCKVKAVLIVFSHNQLAL